MKRTILYLLMILVTLSLTGAAIIACDDDDDDNDDEADDDDDDDDDDDNDDETDDDDDIENPDVFLDETSGLMWAKNVADDKLTLNEATTHCYDLDFGGYDDWHLPSISQLRSLIRNCPQTETGGICDVTDECLAGDGGCWSDDCFGCNGSELEGPGPHGQYWPAELDGAIGEYWSSNCDSEYGWFVDFESATVGSISYLGKLYVRCARNAE